VHVTHLQEELFLLFVQPCAFKHLVIEFVSVGGNIEHGEVTEEQ